MTTGRTSEPTPQEYEAPKLVEIGGVYELTLRGCFMDKKWGGSDGLSFGPITIPVSSC
jgi:hypothetical protein